MQRHGVSNSHSCPKNTVAVCGLPEPNDDHAIVMAKFARDCLSKMDELTRKLEVRLGKSLKCIFGWNQNRNDHDANLDFNYG